MKQRYSSIDEFLNSFWKNLSNDEDLKEHEIQERFAKMQYMFEDWNRNEEQRIKNDLEREKNDEKFKKRYRLAIAGLVISLIGVCIVAYRLYVGAASG